MINIILLFKNLLLYVSEYDKNINVKDKINNIIDIFKKIEQLKKYDSNVDYICVNDVISKIGINNDFISSYISNILYITDNKYKYNINITTENDIVIHEILINIIHKNYTTNIKYSISYKYIYIKISSYYMCNILKKKIYKLYKIEINDLNYDSKLELNSNDSVLYYDDVIDDDDIIYKDYLIYKNDLKYIDNILYNNKLNGKINYYGDLFFNISKEYYKFIYINI